MSPEKLFSSPEHPQASARFHLKKENKLCVSKLSNLVLICLIYLFIFILKHLAYEYAKRGAYLALVARRENRLQEVAAVAESIGSPYALVIPADISKVEDCKRCIQTTVTHFRRRNPFIPSIPLNI